MGVQTKSFQTKFRLRFVSVIPYLLSYFHCGAKNVTCQNVEVADTYACLAQDPMGTCPEKNAATVCCFEFCSLF